MQGLGQPGTHAGSPSSGTVNMLTEVIIFIACWEDRVKMRHKGQATPRGKGALAHPQGPSLEPLSAGHWTGSGQSTVPHPHGNAPPGRQGLLCRQPVPWTAGQLALQGPSSPLPPELHLPLPLPSLTTRTSRTAQLFPCPPCTGAAGPQTLQTQLPWALGPWGQSSRAGSSLHA